MAEEEESFENLDDLDWSDVEDELKANKDEILSQAAAGKEEMIPKFQEMMEVPPLHQGGRLH